MQAHLRARLVGLPLLRVDGTVLMSPGRLADPLASNVAPAPAAVQPEPARARASGPTGHTGDDLAEAARLIGECDRALRRSSVVRADGASLR